MELTAIPQTLAAFNGPTSKGEEEGEESKGRGEKGKGRVGEEKGGSVAPKGPIGESGSVSDYRRYPVTRYL